MRSPPLVPQGLPPAPLYAIVPPFDADARGNDEGGDIEDIEDIDHDPVDRGGGSVVFYLDCLTDDLNDLFVSEDNEERVCLADRIEAVFQRLNESTDIAFLQRVMNARFRYLRKRAERRGAVDFAAVRDAHHQNYWALCCSRD